MTEYEMLTALRTRYCSREFALIPQVRNSTGFASRTRTADAIAVSLWPSKGIHVEGFEFKSSRSDWLKELKDSAKSEEIGRFCKFWHVLAADASIVQYDEIPELWGLLVIEDGKIKVVKKAPARDAEPPSWRFVAAVLKSASEIVIPESAIVSRVNKAVSAALDAERKAREKLAADGRVKESAGTDRILKAVTEFENASGVKIDIWNASHAKKIGEAVKFVLAGGLDRSADRLLMLAEEGERVRRVLSELNQKEG